MPATITAFAESPDRGQGLARDTRIRWALAELGVPYDVKLLSFAELKEPAHRRRNPFGQIPTYEHGDFALFETGAIILHLAETNEGLLPRDPVARARTIAWMFAAVGTIEPPIVERSMAWMLERERSWYDDRLPMLDNRIRQRLGDLSTCLGTEEWLEGPFSAGDLMVIDVLRRLRSSGLLDEFPVIATYVARGEARPAFRQAFDAQYAVFEAAAARSEAAKGQE